MTDYWVTLDVLAWPVLFVLNHKLQLRFDLPRADELGRFIK
jgi:hypothetical protein